MEGYAFIKRMMKTYIDYTEVIVLKIGIIGAGAMGSLYGGILAEAGHEVYFIDVYEAHVDAVNANGLIINKNGEERAVKGIRATTKAEEVGPVELAIVFVKSTITDIAVQSNKAVFDENTIVLTLQNGLGNIEKIETVVDASQIIAGTSANGANMAGPGKVNHAGFGGTTIGELSGEITDRIREIERVLSAKELGPVKISENVIGLIWDKLLVNVGINPLTALTHMRNGELLDYPETTMLMDTVVNEAIVVAKAKGITLGFADPLGHVKDVTIATSGNISSMLSDILNHRKTEIDNINGAIVREGKVLGIPTPANEMVTNLMKGKEKTKLNVKID